MNKRINVLHLFYSFKVGGAQRLLVDLVSNNPAGSGIGHNLAVIMGLIDEDFHGELEKTNSNLYIFPENSYKNKFSTLIKLINIIIKNKINVIHVHEPVSAKWAALCKALFPAIKIAYTIHSANKINTLTNTDIFISRLFIDSHIAISDSVLDECNRLKMKKSKRIYNGVKLSRFVKNEKIFSDKLNIINVSRIALPVKGQDILIRALNECRERGVRFNCSFVGAAANRESLNALKQLAAELRLEEKIKFLGNRHDIPELLSQADLFILSSRYEGFGLVIIEAMAAGLPVIAGNIHGPKELITDGINGVLFESENHIDLADKICDLYENRDKMPEISENARKFAQEFDISVMVSKYNDVYRDLVPFY